MYQSNAHREMMKAVKANPAIVLVCAGARYTDCEVVSARYVKAVSASGRPTTLRVGEFTVTA